MSLAVIICFIVAYILIVFEHPLKLDKSVPALMAGVVCWSIIAISDLPLEGGTSLENGLSHSLSKIAEILLFLIGAMTIVELIDLHHGFKILSDLIKATSKYSLLVIISFFAFFLSAILDNLTTTIVMITIIRKLVASQEDRLYYASFVIIAANAGGAWSPIGDVTTTMLWIDNKVSTLLLIEYLIVPSLICILIPLAIAYFLPVFKGKVKAAQNPSDHPHLPSSRIILFFGIGGLIFVPIFKQITHLPPYLGMMFSLAVIWLVSDLINYRTYPPEELGKKLSIKNALSRIEMPSILFFFGILAAVSALEVLGHLSHMALYLDQWFGNTGIVAFILGLLSAIVDNVPLVAASLGMYNFEIDHAFWHEIAFAAGTGGSILVIGSAAGVAAMGMEKINFIWYLKKISWIALLGYLGGWLVLYFTH